MQKFLYSDIERESHHIERLEVQSFEMNVYLIKLHMNGKQGFVYGNDDRPQRFNASQEIREAFAHCKVDIAVMVHESPYDEMIGNPRKAAYPMELPFSMALPY
ncbi:MAG: DUF6482 family protein [Pseudomonadota bacterium]